LPLFGIYAHPGHSISITPLQNVTVNFQVHLLPTGW
jgi:hypothetical protein